MSITEKNEESWNEVEKVRTTENERKILSIDELKPGDHIVLSFNDHDYFHSIFIDTQNIDGSNLIEIIFYNNEKMSVDLQGLIVSSIYSDSNEVSNESLINNYGVKKEKLIYDGSNFEIYQVLYDCKSDCCLSVKEILENANKLVGEAKYNSIENNDENFAIFCRTGKAGKLFFIDTAKVNVQELFGVDIFEKIKGNIKFAGTNLVLFNVAQRIASRFPRNIVATSLPTLVQKGTSIIGLGLEGFCVGNDIHAKYLETKEGKLTNLKFKKYILKRVSKSTMGIVGGIAGGIVGQTFIPAPVIGAMVGGFLGGLLGSAVGYAQGALIGEVVESVDYKVHQFFTQNLPPLEENAVEMKTLELNDKIESEYVIVEKDDCVDNSTESEIFNQDHYDIYLLDDELGSIENTSFNNGYQNNSNSDIISISLFIKDTK